MPSERQLSGVLSEFARTMVTDFSIQDILERLVERIVEIFPITGAGVTLISETEQPRYVAASDDAALRFEQLQSELGEGPCLAAYRTGTAISVENLAQENRFVLFAPRAVREGLAAVFTFPLRHGDRQMGALDLYRSTPGSLDEVTMVAAQTLADVAAAYLLNAQARSDLTEASIWFQENSLHDPLTGLPNRLLLLERLEHALVRGRRTGRTLAVLFADLDRFKAVNDVHGHSVGDELLVAVAHRIGGVLREGDTLARLSGDEFVILCEDLMATSEADVIASRLGKELRLPFVLSSAEVRLTASVGIAFAGQGNDLLPSQILHRADTAMYQAKRNGGGHHLILDDVHRGGHPGDLTQDLVGAVARGELDVLYQPIVAARDARVVGVEALLRWAHPYRGAVPPAVFIPLAEQAGLITGIGRWVLEAAFRDKSSWGATGHRDPLGMSLNVSVHQLMSPDFASTVASVLDATSTEPEAITLELTESAFIRDSERALIVLTDLKKLGLSIALDDFGTGYSSLSLLNRFPVDVVKIDKSFVQDLGGGDTVSRAIVSAVINLCHALGMTVTAEGVETAEQHRELVALGCDNCQGYHFARPMSVGDLVAAV
jgi:diguanylate cyclase (GGDEF)-like protein